MLKKLFYKTILFCILLVALNFIYTKWFYENDIQKHSELINIVREVPNDADIIYLGESSNKTFREDDLDRRKISSFIGDYYPNLHTHDITKDAAHAGIYNILLENISNDNQVKTIIVTLNLRSFGAAWIYSDLETPLQKSILLIKDNPPLLNRFLLSFKVYDIKNKEERKNQFKEKWKNDKLYFEHEHPYKNVIEWDYWMATEGAKYTEGEKDQEKTDLSCHYVKSYAFIIDTLTNPRIKDFNNIVNLAKKKNWNLVFNLLAENTSTAKELVGDELVNMMNNNAEMLVHYFGRKGVIVVNNLNLVKNEEFIDQNWTTEHYAEKGRKIIARNTAIALKKWYKNDYVDINQ